MIVACCEHKNRRTNGKTKSGAIRYRCKDCGKSWTESTSTLGGMRIGIDQAAKVIEMLCEGVSVRATARITGTDLKTILNLLLMLGERCEAYMAETIKGVFVGECQIDELWSYVFCKAATAKREKYVGGCGDNYCYTAIDRSTKLLVTWHMGRRNEKHTDQFIAKLEAATYGHFHVSLDHVTIIADNGGGLTLQIDNGSYRWQHTYDHAWQMADDIANYISGGDVTDYEGNQVTEYGWLEPSDDQLRNGGYRVLDIEGVMSAEDHGWRNIRALKEAVCKIVLESPIDKI